MADAKALCAPTAKAAKRRPRRAVGLEATGRWLVVFDNAEDTATLKPYLPETTSGHVLVTSRNRSWPETTVAVPPWSRAESHLLEHTHP